jgi:type I restriction enzyme S subunit
VKLELNKMGKQYPAYKPSGVEWIGKIPKHWGMNKLKYCDNIIMGQSPNSDDYNYIGIGIPFIQGNAEFKRLHPDPKLWCETANKIAIANDILISVRAPIGAVNIAERKIGIGRGLCAIRAKQDNYKFLYYYFIILNEELNSIGTGSTYTAISAEEVKNVLLITPPIPEQTAIAAFLDEKTCQIDSLIEKKQRLIELLKEERTAIINQAVTKGINPNIKLKPSGIEWLGNIPEHWQVKKYWQKIGSAKRMKKRGRTYRRRHCGSAISIF